MSLVTVFVLPACKEAKEASATVKEKLPEPPRPSREAEPGLLVRAPVEPCPEHNCGSNSAVVNGSALGSLRLGGQSNRNGFSIERSLHPRDGAADPVLRLEVREGQIVGVDGKGEVAAMGDELKGRWFRLVRHEPGRASEVRGKIRIVDVARVRLMAVRPQAVPGPGKLTPEVAVGYELAYEPESSAGAMNLCRYQAPLFWPSTVERASSALDRAWDAVGGALPESVTRRAKPIKDVVSKLPRSVLETVRRELSLDQPSTLVFAIKGEAYDEITASIHAEPESFTLACPGTALSKMKLMGYDPEDQRFPTTIAQRRAVINMITGRYCGAFVFTTDGQQLSWENQDRWFYWTPDGEVEAVWNEHGAMCLNRPRSSMYTREMVAEYCRDLPPCGASVSRDSLPEGAELISILPAK